MKTNDEAGTDETIDDGTVKIALDGTDDGTLVYSTTTNPLVDNEITWLTVNDETTEAGTTTNDDHDDGALTVDGNVTYETAVLGTDWMTELGTYDGTLVEATITADGEAPIEMTYELGSDETHEAGTTTGDEKLDGITIDDGMKTNDDVATVETIEDGTDKTADDGTDDGTLVD
jgi:hypothetical protein